MSSVTMHRIRTVELFAGCRRSQFERIDRLGYTMVLPPERQLCVEGESASEFFVLVDGLVDVRVSTGRVARLYPGAWFGELGLIDNARRRATVTTVVQSMFIVYGRREFNTLLTLAPPVRERLQRNASLVLRGKMPRHRPWYQPILDGPRLEANEYSWT